MSSTTVKALPTSSAEPLRPIRHVNVRLGNPPDSRTPYRLIKEQGFPEPIKIGAASRWIDREVEAWIAARPRLRDVDSQAK
jgi:hypothetical protein